MGLIGTIGKGLFSVGRLAGKGVWIVVKGLAVVLSFGVVMWVRHRRNKKMRDRQSDLSRREVSLEQRMSAMETQGEPGAAAPLAAEEAPPAAAMPAEAVPAASSAPPAAPPVTQ